MHLWGYTTGMDGAGADVLETLRQASSQDTTHLKWAEQRLKSWETQPGFYATLLVSNCQHVVYISAYCDRSRHPAVAGLPKLAINVSAKCPL